MAKSAQQKLNSFFDECDDTRAVIKQLYEAAEKRYSGDASQYSYVSGFLSERIIDVVMQLPKTKREVFRQELRRDIGKIVRV